MNKSNKMTGKSLILPLDIHTDQWARTCDRVMIYGSLLFIALIVISGVAPVREIAIAKGELITLDPPVIVQHLEGGIIANLAVREGERVSEGDELLRLVPLSAESSRSTFETRIAGLKLQRERLRAQLEERTPDFRRVAPGFDALAQDQIALYHSELAVLASSAAAFDAEAVERQAELLAAERERTSAIARVAISSEQMSMLQSLSSSGFSSRRAVLETHASLEEDRANVAAVERTLASAHRALADIDNRRAQAKTQVIEKWSREISVISAEIADIEHSLQKATDQVSRLNIRAPVSGIIHEISPKGSGEVISPGGQILTIFPTDSKIVAEVDIRPEDIGHIDIEYPAEIVVTAFDEGVFGRIGGVISFISPTTFESENGEPFYRGRIEIEKQEMRAGEDAFNVLPGMTIRAEILTGEKSVLQYIMKPIVSALRKSFRER